ncbi:peptidoglycan-binding domain-containing protein [Kiloniella majae]|uniref:peptidoglycan-binding domain-containing protein n=1 Tax=Kiloniella majae TaxID=1938558 RepID=UPI000A27812E|nr:peptidoglycan-binding domain-containing protein [Kiloniella majae]
MSDDKLKSEDEKPTSRKSRQQTTRKTTAKKSSAKAKPQEKSTPASTKKPAAKKAAGPKKTTASATPAEKEKTTGDTKKTGPVAKTVTAKAKRVVEKSKSEPANGTSKGATKITVGPASGSTKETEDKVTNKKVTPSQSDKSTSKAKGPIKSPTADPKDAVARPKKGYSLAKMVTVAAVLFLGVLAVFFVGNDSIFTENPEETPPPVAQAKDEPNPNASSPYGMRVEQLKEIEGLLASLNFDPGRIDGEIDHEAVAAISLFQEISGLEVDGKPTPDLLAELKAVDEMLSN